MNGEPGSRAAGEGDGRPRTPETYTWPLVAIVIAICLRSSCRSPTESAPASRPDHRDRRLRDHGDHRREARAGPAPGPSTRPVPLRRADSGQRRRRNSTRRARPGRRQSRRSRADRQPATRRRHARARHQRHHLRPALLATRQRRPSRPHCRPNALSRLPVPPNSNNRWAARNGSCPAAARRRSRTQPMPQPKTSRPCANTPPAPATVPITIRNAPKLTRARLAHRRPRGDPGPAVRKVSAQAPVIGAEPLLDQGQRTSVVLAQHPVPAVLLPFGTPTLRAAARPGVHPAGMIGPAALRCQPGPLTGHDRPGARHGC